MHPKDPNYPKPSSSATTAVMKSNKRTDTKPELVIRSLLNREGLRFRKDYPIKVDRRTFRPDIAFTKYKLAIFIDGCFWHSCPEHGHIPKSNITYWEQKFKQNKERDVITTNLLLCNGWHVLRIWEHTAPEEALILILNKISNLTK